MKKKYSKTKKSKGGVAPPSQRNRVTIQTPLSVREARDSDDASTHPRVQELRNALEENDPYAFSEALDRAYFDIDTLVDVYMSTPSERDGFDYSENYFIAIQDLVNRYLTRVIRINEGQPIYDLHQDIFHNSRSQQGQFVRTVNQLNENEELEARYRRGVVGSRYWTDEYRRLNDLFASFFVRILEDDSSDQEGESVVSGGKKKSRYCIRKRKSKRKRKQGKKNKKTRKN